jgi:heat shock protein HtpX
VLKSAGCRKRFRLRILEVKGEEALACNNDVIAVSKELLNRLTEDELKGVLAHELGHLISKDTMIAWAFVTAGDLPGMLRRVCSMVWRGYRILRLFVGMLIGLLLLVLVLLFLFKPFAVLPVMAFVFLLLLFWLLDRLFRWLRLILSRKGEYRQDAFAHRLGYGPGLREALKKIAHYGREHVNAYFILMNGTHPVIYDRIRRLEQMIGLRINS